MNNIDIFDLENMELGEEVTASKEAQYLSKLEAQLAKIKAAKARGADMQRTPSGLLDNADDQHTPLADDWRKKIRFRCSSLEKLMTEGRGQSSEEKLQKFINELSALEAKTELLRAEVIATHEAYKQEYETKANAGKNERIRQAAASLLAQLGEWSEAPKWQTHLAKIASLQAQINDAKSNAKYELSASAKSVCEQVFADAYFGYAANALSGGGVKSLQHGVQTEQYCIDRYAILSGLKLAKNTERLYNDLLTGEADSIAPVGTNADGSARRVVVEFKSATSPVSFVNQITENDSKYHYQVQGYMLLYGCEEARIVTNLVPTIDMPFDAYDGVPEAKKVHVRYLKRDEHCIRMIEKRLKQAYEYTVKFGENLLMELGRFTG